MRWLRGRKDKTDFVPVDPTISGSREARVRELWRISDLGADLVDRGKLRQGVRRFEEALAIAREVGHRKSEARMLFNLGSTYSELGQRKKAKELYLQAVAIDEQLLQLMERLVSDRSDRHR